MQKRNILFLFFVLLPSLVIAGEYQLKPDLKVIIPEMTRQWIVSTEPTTELVEHLAEHVFDDAIRKGQTPTNEQVQKVAMQRARNNDLFMVNHESGAHVLISFSAIDEGEKEPSSRTVANSARYAIDGVEDEGWIVTSVRKAEIAMAGAQEAQWFAIDYTQDGKANLFMGMVGFANPYWFWFYGNDHLKDPKDRDFLEQLMKSIQIHTRSE